MYLSHKYKEIKLKNGNLKIYDGIVLQLTADTDLLFGDLVELLPSNHCNYYNNNIFKLPLICISDQVNTGHVGEFLLKGIIKLDPSFPIFSDVVLNSCLYSNGSFPATIFSNEDYNYVKNIFPVLGYRISSNFFYYNPKNFTYCQANIPKYIIDNDIFDGYSSSYVTNNYIELEASEQTQYCFGDFNSELYNTKTLTIKPFQLVDYRYIDYIYLVIYNKTDSSNLIKEYEKQQSILINPVINFSDWIPVSASNNDYALQLFGRDNFNFNHMICADLMN